MIGKIFLVATPIGNLEDMTFRALDVLKSVDIIAAEDTRHTLKLLNHYNISKPLISYYKEIEKNKSDVIISKVVEGKNIAIVSDAGTPCISDPGEELVKKAISVGIDVIPIPGACAFVNSLIVSGMNTREFCFVGFLPTHKKEKREKIEELANETKTIIIYEAPHRIIDTLTSLREIIGDRNICIVRELTKIHEEKIRGKISQIISEMQDPKGEMVIILEGSNISKKDIALSEINSLSLEEHYDYYKKQGFSKKEIIKLIAKDRKVSKNEIYQHFISR